MTQADKESLEAQVQALQTSEAKLKLENAQLKEVAEVARQQSVAMEMWQKSRDLEMSSLRHQLLDLQMQSDDKTATGKLHHQIMTLQVGEATALKKLEEANGKVSLSLSKVSGQCQPFSSKFELGLRLGLRLVLELGLRSVLGLELRLVLGLGSRIDEMGRVYILLRKWGWKK